ncbi:1,3-propanediol dehydrogenase [Calditerricola satsumensis]|uniref:1,3-propanediol dehydrogenase n=1 Tax=Calditerricola satsumensis TaxID=373054 RepID=A0A8J3B8J9_9BACI|nr:1,3-propanediol dehydrogenase [Calditerricola satsumensis]
MERVARFRIPSVVVYGRGALGRVGEEARRLGAKALIVCDAVMERLGAVAECRAHLAKAGVEAAVYTGVNTEPIDAYVDEALAMYRVEGCDHLIALGGGSAIDTAKAVALLAENGGRIADYHAGERTIRRPSAPLIAVPTTAGTGSEVTDVTVITNTATAVKMMIKHPTLLPTVALVDPLLTVSSPPAVTASSGLDALCHAVEAYLSRRAQPLTDALALSAVRRIAGHLRRAYANGQDLEAREAMALAAMEAGMAFSNASVALVHGMSRPVGALFHVPHGIANAMLMPAVLEYTKPACVARLAVIGRAMCPDVAGASDEEAAEEAIREIKRLCRDLAIPNLQAWGGGGKGLAREGEQDGRRRLGQRQPRQQPARADAGGHCCSL